MDPNRLFRRLASRLGPLLQSDTAFIQAAYREILQRDADEEGLKYYRQLLRGGVGRTAVLLSLMRSDEHARALGRRLPSVRGLRLLRPERYHDTIDRTNNETIRVFHAESPADFDWLESAILENGYYEKPGVWTLDVDVDKRLIAEIVASFAPQRPLELGCAAGAVLDCLHADGIPAEGVEISSMAIARAPERVRGRIHQGDLLTLDLPTAYDLVFGLDIYEHLNPNRLDAYLARLAQITVPDAYLFCNIPAFGEDPVFGTVFPLYVDGWEQDAAAGRPFMKLHVDDEGFPIHGHLTWADARWWVERFAAHGFRREVEIERALHRKYDTYMRKQSPARLAYFVLSTRPTDASRAAIVQRIARPSRVLASQSISAPAQVTRSENLPGS